MNNARIKVRESAQAARRDGGKEDAGSRQHFHVVLQIRAADLFDLSPVLGHGVHGRIGRRQRLPAVPDLLEPAKARERQRLQAFEGVVIAKRNRGLNSSFIVRKISNGEGVERTFQLYSPLIAKIEVKRRGDVRRAKLYYLRSRSGKSARIKEKLGAKAA